MPSAPTPGPVDKYEVAGEMFPDQPPGFPFEEFELRAIRMPADDDMGIHSEDDKEDEDEEQQETGFGSVIVVSNLPVVTPEKYDKLAAVVQRIYGQIGKIREGGFYMPLDDKNSVTKGFAFIEFNTVQEAQAAREQTNGYKLDKNHTFAVNMFDDLDKYAKVPDTYTAPEVKPFQPTENLHSWMLDKLGRDQFAIRSGDDTQVLWNDGKRSRCEGVYQRQFWTESFVQWSPMGNMLGTLHRQGVATWGGPSFVRLARYNHPNVRLLEFSPNERFLITYSSQEPSNPRETVTCTFCVFDVRTGRKLRVFEGAADEFAVGTSASAQGTIRWPVFKWAGGRDDLYFSRLGKNMISVYSTTDMGLLDKKSLKMDGVQDFEWSPSEPVMCVYNAEMGNMPARVVLVKIPERTEIRQKNLFSVSDIKIHWHPQGDYLAVKVDRFTKTKKSTYTGFELFSIRDKDIPMEVLELPNKSEKIIGFAWEPKGHRFAIVHGDGPRPTVSFYTMKDDKGRLAVKMLGSLPGKSCNQIYWSPQGRNIVFAALKGTGGPSTGQLEFFNVDEMEVMGAAEHFMATDVDWDPTGRYVVTSVTAMQMENGFNVWSFNGKLLYTQSKDRMMQFSWRPRLPTLLPAEKEAEIFKNLKSYTKRYDEEDEQLLMQADADVLEERKRLQEEWDRWAASKREFQALLEGFRKQMYGSKWDEKESYTTRVTVEQVVDVKEEPYNR